MKNVFPIKIELPRSGEGIDTAFRDPFRRNAFFLAKVPSLAFFGAEVAQMNRQECHVSIPYDWRTQNPFRSIYFGAQASVAELSTGALVIRAMAELGLGPDEISMLVVSMSCTFGKKARSKTTFRCVQGEEVHQAVARAVKGEDVIIDVESVGTASDGTEVSHFSFKWAIKNKA
jgi:acyl-coenzyme A thioesterase PaaI-like protein